MGISGGIARVDSKERLFITMCRSRTKMRDLLEIVHSDPGQLTDQHDPSLGHTSSACDEKDRHFLLAIWTS